MDQNPYAAPQGTSPPGWRPFWKRLCLGSLATALILLVFDQAVVLPLSGESPSPLYLIFNALSR